MFICRMFEYLQWNWVDISAMEKTNDEEQWVSGVDVMYLIGLDCTSVPNKLASHCKPQIIIRDVGYVTANQAEYDISCCIRSTQYTLYTPFLSF